MTRRDGSVPFESTNADPGTRRGPLRDEIVPSTARREGPRRDPPIERSRPCARSSKAAPHGAVSAQAPRRFRDVCIAGAVGRTAQAQSSHPSHERARDDPIYCHRPITATSTPGRQDDRRTSTSSNPVSVRTRGLAWMRECTSRTPSQRQRGAIGTRSSLARRSAADAHAAHEPSAPRPLRLRHVRRRRSANVTISSGCRQLVLLRATDGGSSLRSANGLSLRLTGHDRAWRGLVR